MPPLSSRLYNLHPTICLMMKYNNADVRRRDRLLNEERALELLRESEYCVLSMIDEEGKPRASSIGEHIVAYRYSATRKDRPKIATPLPPPRGWEHSPLELTFHLHSLGIP